MKSLHALIAVAASSAALTATAATPAANWSEHCAKCHGEDGKGDTKMGKKLSIADLSSAAVQAKFTDEEAFKAMKQGLKDKNDKTTMKAIEGLTDEEFKALITFVRGLKK
jgi:cytochrome c553